MLTIWKEKDKAVMGSFLYTVVVDDEEIETFYYFIDALNYSVAALGYQPDAIKLEGDAGADFVYDEEFLLETFDLIETCNAVEFVLCNDYDVSLGIVDFIDVLARQNAAVVETIDWLDYIEGGCVTDSGNRWDFCKALRLALYKSYIELYDEPAKTEEEPTEVEEEPTTGFDIRISKVDQYKKLRDLSTRDQLLILHAMERKYPEDLSSDIWDTIRDISADSLAAVHRIKIEFVI